MKSRAFGFVAGRCLEAVSGSRVGGQASDKSEEEEQDVGLIFRGPV